MQISSFGISKSLSLNILIKFIIIFNMGHYKNTLLAKIKILSFLNNLKSLFYFISIKMSSKTRLFR